MKLLYKSKLNKKLLFLAAFLFCNSNSYSALIEDSNPDNTPPIIEVENILEVKNPLDEIDLVGFKISDYDLKSLQEFHSLLRKNSVDSTKHLEPTYPLGLSKRAFNCLVLNAYHEARGEKYRGVAAVVEVVLNRTKERNKSVCNVIYEPYQFSWTRDRNKRVDKKEYEVVEGWVLKHLEHLENDGNNTITKGATYFHTKHVSPSWSRSRDFKCTTKVGKHLFYREMKTR